MSQYCRHVILVQVTPAELFQVSSFRCVYVKPKKNNSQAATPIVVSLKQIKDNCKQETMYAWLTYSVSVRPIKYKHEGFSSPTG